MAMQMFLLGFCFVSRAIRGAATALRRAGPGPTTFGRLSKPNVFLASPIEILRWADLHEGSVLSLVLFVIFVTRPH